MGATPNFDLQIASAWGSIYENSRVDCYVASAIAVASGIRTGGNPPYTLNDLAAIYPFFLGAATPIAGADTDGTTGIILLASTTGLSVGALVTGPNIPNGSFITNINLNVSITISNNTSGAGSNLQLSAYVTPPIPFAVLSIYITLAMASISINAYADSWYMCMALFIAHYATLWALNNQSPNATIGQIAQSGMAAGIQIFKHAGDLSVNNQILDDLKGWGTYQLTSYGQQLATIMKAVNSMSMLIY